MSADGICPKLIDMIEFSRQRDVTIVELGPSYESLDDRILEEIRGALLSEASKADPPPMVLDLSGTNYIGSAFIELLVRVWKRLTERGGTMVLCGLRPFCAEVLRVTGLDHLWRVFPTQDQAVTAIKEDPRGPASSRA